MRMCMAGMGFNSIRSIIQSYSANKKLHLCVCYACGWHGIFSFPVALSLSLALMHSHRTYTRSHLSIMRISLMPHTGLTEERSFIPNYFDYFELGSRIDICFPHFQVDLNISKWHSEMLDDT